MPVGALGQLEIVRKLLAGLLHASLDFAHIGQVLIQPAAIAGGQRSLQRRRFAVHRVQQAQRLLRGVPRVRRRCCHRRTAARTQPAGCSASAAATSALCQEIVLRYAQLRPSPQFTLAPSIIISIEGSGVSCPIFCAMIWSTRDAEMRLRAGLRACAPLRNGGRRAVVIGRGAAAVGQRRAQIADHVDLTRGMARAAAGSRRTRSRRRPSPASTCAWWRRAASRCSRTASRARPPSGPAASRPESSTRAAAAPGVTPGAMQKRAARQMLLRENAISLISLCGYFFILI